MTTSRRLADRKVDRFDKKVTKRGAVGETSTRKGKDYPVGPLLLGFFIFVVIGSFWTRSPIPLLTVFVLRSSKLEGEGGQLLIKRGWMSTLLDYDAFTMKVRFRLSPPIRNRMDWKF
ncbi:hypothetical protein NC652_000700 [Populus alba x Populus x berolinensis]|nr:hypothetical protein NC652_000700 [Populus alba x Populus x berolinensis]